MQVTVLKIGILLSLIFASAAWAEETKPYGFRRGYVESVIKEKRLRIVEVAVVPDPRRNDPSVKEMIFDKKVTKQIQTRYEDRFGRVQATQLFNESNRFAEYQYSANVILTPEQDFRERQAFGHFMLRKLTEYHVDRFTKNNEAVRPLYKAKNALSNASLSVKKGYKLKMRYSLSDGSAEMRFLNPLDIDMRLVFRSNQDGDTLFNMGYNLTKTFRMISDYGVNNQTWSLTGVQRLGDGVNATVTGTTHFAGDELPNDRLFGPRDRRLIFGLNFRN